MCFLPYLLLECFFCKLGATVDIAYYTFVVSVVIIIFGTSSFLVFGPWSSPWMQSPMICHSSPGTAGLDGSSLSPGTATVRGVLSPSRSGLSGGRANKGTGIADRLG